MIRCERNQSEKEEKKRRIKGRDSQNEGSHEVNEGRQGGNEMSIRVKWKSDMRMASCGLRDALEMLSPKRHRES